MFILLALIQFKSSGENGLDFSQTCRIKSTLIFPASVCQCQNDLQCMCSNIDTCFPTLERPFALKVNSYAVPISTTGELWLMICILEDFFVHKKKLFKKIVCLFIHSSYIMRHQYFLCQNTQEFQIVTRASDVQRYAIERGGRKWW